MQPLSIEFHCGFMRGENQNFYVEISWHHGRSQWLWQVDDIPRGRMLMHGHRENFTEALNKLKEVMMDCERIQITFSEETEQIMIKELGHVVAIDWDKEFA